MDYSIDFLPVGDSNGDAICIAYQDIYEAAPHIDIIDGGYSDIGESLVKHLDNFFGTRSVDNVLLTHADDDHAVGLIKVMEQCIVGTLYMNRPWLFVDSILHHFHGNYTRQGLIDRLREMHPYLVDLEEIAYKNGVKVCDAFQGTQFGCSTILAPSRERYISLLPDLEKTPTAYRSTSNPFVRAAGLVRGVVDDGLEYWDVETLEEHPTPTSASNETSVVQQLQFGEFTALLTGDAGPKALHEAADYAEMHGYLQRPNVFQIPHQGSRRNVTPSSLNRWLGGQYSSEPSEPRGYAACSVGANKTSHPRKKVTNALRRRGYKTQLARKDTLQYGYGTLKRNWGNAPVVPWYHDVTEDEDR